jgi:hypothetical protein
MQAKRRTTMNARTLYALSSLILTGLTTTAATAATAGEAGTTLAWQQPGYVEEVVMATAPRPLAVVRADATADGSLAREAPGYVEEVVVVRASRREVLATALARRLAARQSFPVDRGTAMGMPLK